MNDARRIFIKQLQKNFIALKFNLFYSITNNPLMIVKIDTKEHFTVLIPGEKDISANMTVELTDLLINQLKNPVPHVVLNMKNVQTLSRDAGEQIGNLQQQFYEKNASFVICELSKNIQNALSENNLSDHLNIAPTESEAWDILQMEEIERELMADPDDAETGNAAF